MYVALARWNNVENLISLVATKHVNAVDEVVPQLGHDAVHRLQEGLKRAYSIVRTPYSVVLTLVSRVVVTKIQWKDEDTVVDDESGPADDRTDEVRQAATKASQPRESGKDCSTRN